MGFSNFDVAPAQIIRGITLDEINDLESLAHKIEEDRESIGVLADIDSIVASWSVAADKANRKEADFQLAKALHQHLKIDRSQAAKLEFWVTLGIVELSDYLDTRWPLDPEKPNGRLNRVLGSERRYRQGLYRLWIAAERTFDPDEVDEDKRYAYTRLLLHHSAGEDMIMATTESRWAFRLPHAVKAFLGHSATHSGNRVKATAKRLSQAAANIDIETLTQAELRDLLTEIDP